MGISQATKAFIEVVELDYEKHEDIFAYVEDKLDLYFGYGIPEKSVILTIICACFWCTQELLDNMLGSQTKEDYYSDVDSLPDVSNWILHNLNKDVFVDDMYKKLIVGYVE